MIPFVLRTLRADQVLRREAMLGQTTDKDIRLDRHWFGAISSSVALEMLGSVGEEG